MSKTIIFIFIAYGHLLRLYTKFFFAPQDSKNNISGNITVNVVNITIKNNNITTTSDYGIIVKAKGTVITNNIIYAATKFGDNAVQNLMDAVIEDNSPSPSFSLLNYCIGKANANSTLVLGQNYTYDQDIDSEFMNGILIDKNLTIIGNGYSIDGDNQARIFQITNHAQVTIKNIILKQGMGQNENGIRFGGAITVNNFSNLTIIDSNFINNHVDGGYGKAIFMTLNSTLNIITCNFTDDYLQDDTCLYIEDGESVSILDSNIGKEDISNKRGGMGLLAPIKIFTTPNLIFNIQYPYCGHKTTLNIIEPSGFTGIANLITNTGQTIDNIQFVKGIANVNLNLNPGEYNATITISNVEYDTDLSRNIICLYATTNATSKLFTVKYLTNFTIEVNNSIINQPITISVTETNYFNRTVTVTIGAQEYNVTLTNGYGVNNTQVINEIGEYYAKLNFNENENFTEANATSNKFYIKYPTHFKITPIRNSTTDKQITITVNEDNGFTGTITINLNKITCNVTLNNGEGTSKPITLPQGIYTPTINYAGNNTYDATTTMGDTFTINKIHNNIKLTIPNFVEGRSVTIKVTANPEFNGDVQVNINGIKYAVKLVKGVGTKTINLKLKPGTYKATINYPGNEIYFPSNVQSNFKVTKNLLLKK